MPPILIFRSGREADSKVIRMPCPIDTIEPVARVVAVPVQRFGAKEVVACMKEGHSLAQRDQRMTHGAHPHPFLGHEGRWSLLSDRIKDSQVVMAANVGDILMWEGAIGQREAVSLRFLA